MARGDQTAMLTKYAIELAVWAISKVGRAMVWVKVRLPSI